MLYDLEMLLCGAWKAPDLQELQKKISLLNEGEKQTVRDIAEQIITAGMHDLLFALQEQADTDGAVRVLVDGKEIAKLSDGLHGEIFGDEGWIMRYSKYPSEPQIKLTQWANEKIKKVTEDKDDVK